MPSLAVDGSAPTRHTTATHLRRAGVNINTVRTWLGDVFPGTTKIYAEIDVEMKATVPAKCEITDTGELKRRWRDDPPLMACLRSLQHRNRTLRICAEGGQQ